MKHDLIGNGSINQLFVPLTSVTFILSIFYLGLVQLVTAFLSNYALSKGSLFLWFNRNTSSAIILKSGLKLTIATRSDESDEGVGYKIEYY